MENGLQKSVNMHRTACDERTYKQQNKNSLLYKHRAGDQSYTTQTEAISRFCESQYSFYIHSLVQYSKATVTHQTGECDLTQQLHLHQCRILTTCVELVITQRLPSRRISNNVNDCTQPQQRQPTF